MPDVKVRLLAENLLPKAFKEAEAQALGFGQSISKLNTAIRAVPAALAALGISKFGAEALKAAEDAEFLQARLRAFTGSADQTAKAWKQIEDMDFSSIGLDVRTLTDSYIRLKNLGIEDTAKAMRVLSTVATIQGKSIDEVITAIRRGGARLREYGIFSEMSAQKIIDTWGEKYKDAMTAMESTTKAKLDEAGDHWAKFTREVGKMFLPLQNAMIQATSGTLAMINEHLDAGKGEIKLFQKIIADNEEWVSNYLINGGDKTSREYINRINAIKKAEEALKRGGTSAGDFVKNDKGGYSLDFKEKKHQINDSDQAAMALNDYYDSRKKISEKGRKEESSLAEKALRERERINRQEVALHEQMRRDIEEDANRREQFVQAKAKREIEVISDRTEKIKLDGTKHAEILIAQAYDRAVLYEAELKALGQYREEHVNIFRDLYQSLEGMAARNSEVAIENQEKYIKSQEEAAEKQEEILRKELAIQQGYAQKYQELSMRLQDQIFDLAEEGIRNSKASAEEKKDLMIAIATMQAAASAASAISQVWSENAGGNVYANIGLSLGLAAEAALSVYGQIQKINEAKFAAGTRRAPGGLSLVGEEGPELMSMPAGSQVYPAGETTRIINNANNSGTTVNLHFSGTGREWTAEDAGRLIERAFKGGYVNYANAGLRAA